MPIFIPMRVVFSILCTLLLGVSGTGDVFSQENGEPEVYQVVEQMPFFEGCDQEKEQERQKCTQEYIFKFLKEHVRYPADARNKEIEGVVYISFIIETDGRLSNPRPFKSVHPLLDEEALRVVSLMPAWNPGKQKGENVRVSFNLPIRFSLTGKN